MLGYMPMPSNFKYVGVLAYGPPHHQDLGSPSLKHPTMACTKRAKIFSPFAALKGFDDAIERKRIIYSPAAVLSEEEKEEICTRLSVLHTLTLNSRLARENSAVVAVTYYSLCTDPDSEAFGMQGRYVTVEGVCTSADAGVIIVGGNQIAFEDIVSIEGEVFHTGSSASSQAFSASSARFPAPPVDSFPDDEGDGWADDGSDGFQDSGGDGFRTDDGDSFPDAERDAWPVDGHSDDGSDDEWADASDDEFLE